MSDLPRSPRRVQKAGVLPQGILVGRVALGRGAYREGGRPPPDGRRRLLTELHPKVAFDLLQPLTELLSVARQVCGGDADKFLILLVVGVRTAAHPVFKGFSPADLQAGTVPMMPSLGTNMRSIAASLGIPKETTRRKLGELYEAGWLVRVGRDVRLTAKGYQALAPVRERVEALALRNAALVEAVVVGGRVADRDDCRRSWRGTSSGGER